MAKQETALIVGAGRGLSASLAIIGLFSILVTRAWMQVMRVQDGFAQLAVAGLALQFGLQSLVNIAVNLNLIPPKGMTLPFISDGGTSLVVSSLAVGLALGAARVDSSLDGASELRPTLDPTAA